MASYQKIFFLGGGRMIRDPEPFFVDILDAYQYSGLS